MLYSKNLKLDSTTKLPKGEWFLSLLGSEYKKGWTAIFRRRFEKKKFFQVYVLPPFLLAFPLFFFSQINKWVWWQSFLFSPFQVLLLFLVFVFWIFFQSKLISASVAVNQRRTGEQKVFLLSFFSVYPLVLLAPFFALPYVGKLFFLVSFFYSLRFLWQGGSIAFRLEGKELFLWFTNIFVTLLIFVIVFLSFFLLLLWIATMLFSKYQ